jgi:hypothetical protein
MDASDNKRRWNSKGVEIEPKLKDWGSKRRDLLVRGLTYRDIRGLDAAANAAGLSRNEWAKRMLLRAALAPVVRRNYGLVGTAANGARVNI